MNRKLKILNIVTALSIALFYGVGFLFCGAGQDCTDAGLVLAPLFLPVFVLVPVTIIVDIVFLGRRFAPSKHKKLAGWLILAVILSILLVSYTIFEHNQYYSTDKTVAKIKNCQASGLNYKKGDAIYFSDSSMGNKFVKTRESGHARVLQAIRDSAGRCHYNLQYYSDNSFLTY